MPNFDPAQPLPEELQTGPISVPMSMPNAMGGVVIGKPADPLADAIALQAQQARFSTQLRTTPAPMLPMPPGEPMPGAPPGAGIPTTPPAVASQAPAPATAPAPASPPKTGGAPRGDDLERQITDAGKRGEAAIDESQAAKGDAADKLAQAHADLRVQQQADAQELRDRQEQTRLRNEELDRQDAANLKKARDVVIPDFWASSPGAHVASIVSMAMGGIAQGILGGPNGAADIINRKTDEYFQQQKQRVDNLYRYAEQQGKLDDRTRLRYAQELLDLKDQHAAVQQSILTHINEVEKQNAGNVARADTNILKAKLQEDVAKSRMESRVQRAHIAEMQAQTASAYANAEKAKAEAKVAGTLKINEKLEEMTVRDPYTGRPLGLASNPRAVKDVDAQLNAAKTYIDSLEALRDDIKSGYHPVPWTADAQRRMTIYNDAIGKGRKARELGVNTANMNLEEGAFSGPGVGVHPKLITPEQIDLMIKDAKEKAAGTIRQLRPYSGSVAGNEQATFGPVSAPKMVTIKNAKTGETKQVTEDEARKLGALK